MGSNPIRATRSLASLPPAAGIGADTNGAFSLQAPVRLPNLSASFASPPE